MKIIESISHALNTVVMVVLSGVMLLTVADIFLRYAFSQPIIGTTEITKFMVILVGFFGLAWCAVKQGHLKVDMLVSHFSPRLQAIVDSFTHLLGLVICIIIGWGSFQESMTVKQLDLTSSLLEIPQFPFYLAITLGVAILCLVMVAQMTQNIAKAIKG